MANAENHEENEQEPLNGEQAREPIQPPSAASQEEQPAVSKEKQPTVTITLVELEKLKKDAAESKDKYLRGLAESENARKRLQKERQELIQYALQNLIVDFLHPIDHFENALKFTDQASPEVKHWATGFQMILNQFKDVLANNGVTPFKSVGTHFDPHCHEAVEMVTTTEHPPGIVVAESLQGYKMGDRTIRPARVKVAKSPPKNETKKEPQEGNSQEPEVKSQKSE